MYLLLVRTLASATARERIGPLAALLAIVVGIAYIGSVAMRWGEWWGLVGRLDVPPLRPLFASLTLGSPNTVLTVMVLLATSRHRGTRVASRERRLGVSA